MITRISSTILKTIEEGGIAYFPTVTQAWSLCEIVLRGALGVAQKVGRGSLL